MFRMGSNAKSKSPGCCASPRLTSAGCRHWFAISGIFPIRASHAEFAISRRSSAMQLLCTRAFYAPTWRQGENAAVKGLPFTLLSLVAGWWGIPWGPIYTIQAIYNNSRGGKDVTQTVVNSLRAQGASAQAASPIPAKT